MRLVLISALLMAAAVVGPIRAVAEEEPPPPVPVASCGEVVTNGYLTTDLDCSGSSSYWAVVISEGGTLDLAGHVLTGTTYQAPGYDPLQDGAGGGVHCVGTCTILGGGGAIRSPGGMPANAVNSLGVFGSLGRSRALVSISDTEISGWRSLGILAYGSLSLTGCNVSGNGNGAATSTRGVATVVGSVFSGNSERGITVYRAKVSGSTFENNGWNGIYALRRLFLEDSVISGSSAIGLFAVSLRAENSTVQGNCALPYPGTDCADLQIYRRPVVATLVCDSSLRFSPDTLSWGICSLD